MSFRTVASGFCVSVNSLILCKLLRVKLKVGTSHNRGTRPDPLLNLIRSFIPAEAVYIKQYKHIFFLFIISIDQVI